MSPAANAFLDTLTDIREGATLADLHHALTALVGAVRSVGKSGTLTLKITVAPAKGSSAALLVTDEIGLKEPKIDKETTIMFADEANRLTRWDPRQPKLPEIGPAEIRAFPIAVNESTGEILE